VTADWHSCLGELVLFVDGGLGLIILVLWLFCLFDVITTDASLCRNLPKPLWVIIVLLLPDVGSIIWLAAGHPWQSTQQRPGGLPYKGNLGYGSGAQQGRLGQQSRVTGRSSNPDDDEDFMRQVRLRAEQQRRAVRPPEDPQAD
jgi:hypothetical protein